MLSRTPPETTDQCNYIQDHATKITRWKSRWLLQINQSPTRREHWKWGEINQNWTWNSSL